MQFNGDYEYQLVFFNMVEMSIQNISGSQMSEKNWVLICSQQILDYMRGSNKQPNDYFTEINKVEKVINFQRTSELNSISQKFVNQIKNHLPFTLENISLTCNIEGWVKTQEDNNHPDVYLGENLNNIVHEKKEEFLETLDCKDGEVEDAMFFEEF